MKLYRTEAMCILFRLVTRSNKCKGAGSDVRALRKVCINKAAPGCSRAARALCDEIAISSGRPALFCARYWRSRLAASFCGRASEPTSGRARREWNLARSGRVIAPLGSSAMRNGYDCPECVGSVLALYNWRWEALLACVATAL